MANGTWIDRKDDFDTSGGRLRRSGSQVSQKQISQKKGLERVYSVAQVAESLAVTKQTVMKWISIDEPEYAVIPPDKWFKLPNGHIRIKESIVLQLLGEEI